MLRRLIYLSLKTSCDKNLLKRLIAGPTSKEDKEQLLSRVRAVPGLEDLLKKEKFLEIMGFISEMRECAQQHT